MVITGLTRNQLSGLSQTKGSNPLLSAKIARFLAGYFFIVILLLTYIVNKCKILV